MSRSIAVVGAGIFGVTAAVRLAHAGHDVTLYERENEILACASGINQYRLHNGYHYPRSFETACSSRRSASSFRAVYGDAVLDGYEHYYAIAAKDSMTSRNEYIRFLEDVGLPFHEESPGVLDGRHVDLCVRATESLFDIGILRRICDRRLHDARVNLRLGFTVDRSICTEFDAVVSATYANLNDLVPGDLPPRPLQFEVCEKPVIRLPEAFSGTSIVIMDGPFMCFDPLGGSDLFVMGNVQHAIHHTNIGTRPEVPEALLPVLNKGIVKSPSQTNWPLMKAAAEKFFPGVKEAEHIGSMFTIRTVLPGLEASDARPTLVRNMEPGFFQVFSGKIGTCVEAADELCRKIGTIEEAAPVVRER